MKEKKRKEGRFTTHNADEYTISSTNGDATTVVFLDGAMCRSLAQSAEPRETYGFKCVSEELGVGLAG